MFVPRKASRSAAAESLGGRIRKLRLARSWSQAELGRRIGASQRAVAYYERDHTSPSPAALVKLADVLGVSADVLLGRKRGQEPGRQSRIAEIRRLRRLKQLDELPRHERIVVLKILDALADRSARRKDG